MEFGVKIEVDKADLAAVNALVTGLSDFDAEPLVTEIVQLGENQTRKRIESGGPGPEGIPWPPNKEGTAILFRTGRHLRDSVASSSSGTGGEWGAAWEYAHVHQEGAIIKPKNAKLLSFMSGGKRVFASEVYIPVRPFVGVSIEDAQEIKELVTDYLGSLLP